MHKSSALFISHGAPTYILDDIPARVFLSTLGRELPKPDAILCVTAHWETRVPTISSAPHPATVHDFGGFADELYEIEYPAPGAPDVAHLVATELRSAGIDVAIDGGPRI